MAHHWSSDMTDNRFAKPDPSVPGGYLLTPAGTLLMCSNAIHDDDAGAEGKVRAARMIRAVLDAAATNGCTRTEVLETLLCDYGIAPDRRRAAALELAGTVGREGFVHALQRAGIGIRPM